MYFSLIILFVAIICLAIAVGQPITESDLNDLLNEKEISKKIKKQKQ